MDANASDALPEATPGPKSSAEHGSPAWRTLVMALMVALPCLRIPQNSLTTGLDDSWGGVLIYAHERGLQFGRDIAFTYGPLGIFSVTGFSPAVAGLRIFFELLMCFGVAAGLCLLARRMKMVWRVVLLAYFLLFSMPIHWGGDDLLIDLGLLFWGLLCWLESGRLLRICACCLVGLAAVSALIKFTLLVVATFTIVTAAGGLALRGRRRLAAIMVAGYALGFLTGWFCLGQGLSSLGPFLRNSLAVSGGYNLAMGQEDFQWMGGLMVVMMAAAAVTVRVMTSSLRDGTAARLRRIMLLAWLGGLLFLEWKYGYVRTDSDHINCFLGFVPVVALAVTAVPSVRRRMILWERAAALGCVLLAAVFVHQVTPGFLIRVCEHTPGRVGRNVASLLAPAHYAREKSNAYREEQRLNQLPKSRALIGHGTTDVFGQNQMFALFNELAYRPRPVFQSYSVYNRQLMELNEQFYQSTNSPEFVLFNLMAIDERFPPLEDAFVLRDLLFNYQLAGGEGDYLLLHQRQTVAAQLTLVGEGDAPPGGVISLAEYGDTNLWMEITLQPSWPGKIRRVLYKPPEVRLGVWSAADSTPAKVFRAPPPMLAAGFLASPLVLDNADVRNLYEGKPPVRPKAYAVICPPATGNFWQEKVHFRIYRLGNKLGG